MASIKTALISLIFLFLIFPAWGENWVEVTAVGRDQSFYDSDSAFVDYYSGLVVIEMATWMAAEDDYTYLLEGFDCSRQQHYVVGLLTSEGWKYDVYRDFEVSTMGDPTSPFAKTARWACDNYYSLPKDSLPFDCQLSR